MNWIAYGVLALMALLTLLPLFSTGLWWVRLWDFPRVQIGVCVLFPFICALYSGFSAAFGPTEWAMIALSAAIAAWQFAHVAPFTSLWPKEVPSRPLPEAGPDIRLLEVNLKFENNRYTEVVEMIRQQNPNILILLELNEEWSDALAEIREEFSHTETVVRSEGLGIACWVKISVCESEVRHIVEDRRASIWMMLELPGGRRIRVVSIHPTPPGLDDTTDGPRRDSRPRDAELVVIAREVQEKPDGAWMVVGDFNDVAWSHTTRLFRRLSGLLDPRVGRRLLNTYHADWPPFRAPIDHIFLSGGYVLHDIDRVRTPGSDHFAVYTELSLPCEGRPALADADTADFKEAEKILEEGTTEADERGIKASEADLHKIEKPEE